ncbi:MAG: M23 family metallopeptidase [Oscillospiraceae bacterium]|nr:M23 family metallopeptidase [Oscillospiraceae bacterium]MBQ9930241.1 M23 family metallopeptidase [Oscillospiraceae bacterium]
MKSRKNTGKFAGKGYYIALILCAVAIGISGYMYYRNANAQTQDPSTDVGVIEPGGDDIAAIATQPDGQLPTQSTETPIKTGWPVSGQTISGYSMDALSYNETTRDWRVHNGIDIAADAGTPVYAAADGEVYSVFEDDTMGMTVVIRHQGGYVTTYSSLSSDLSVQTGSSVKLGQTIGTVGNTALLENALGDHLHFSVSCNDEIINPADFLALN